MSAETTETPKELRLHAMLEAACAQRNQLSNNLLEFVGQTFELRQHIQTLEAQNKALADKLAAIAVRDEPEAQTGSLADVWEGGGDYPFPAAASPLEFLSTSAADAAAGTTPSFTLTADVEAKRLD